MLLIYKPQNSQVTPFMSFDYFKDNEWSNKGTMSELLHSLLYTHFPTKVSSSNDYNLINFVILAPSSTGWLHGHSKAKCLCIYSTLNKLVDNWHT